MKFKISGESLSRMIQAIQNTNDKIDDRIFFQIFEKTLTATACNEIFQVGHWTNVSDSIDGQFALNMQDITPIAMAHKEFPALMFESHEDGLITIKTGRGRYKIESVDPTDMGIVDIAEIDQKTICIDNGKLALMIDKTINAVSDHSTSYESLKGLHIQNHKNGLQFDATDGNRLHTGCIFLEKNLDIPEIGIIVPKKSLQKIKNICTKQDAHIWANEDRFYANSGNTYIFTKLIAEEFPNISNIIQEPPEHCELNTEEFIESLNRVKSILPKDKSNMSVVLTFSKEKNTLNIKTDTQKTGAEENLKTENCTKDQIIGINYEFLLQGLRIFPTPDIHLLYNDQNGSITLINPEESFNMRVIIMPTRINNLN